MKKSDHITLACMALTCIVLSFAFIADAAPKGKKKSKGAQDWSAQAEKGVLPAWEKGYLDIHSINTGTGESTFIIMPDGTQMLVDMAGAVTSPDDKMFMPFIPDNSRRPGEWINRYMARCMAWTGNQNLDYVSITHFHGDHMGNVSESFPTSAIGDWKTMSVTDVLDGNKVGLLVDRAYPDYSYPRNIVNHKAVANYLKCANWHVENSGMKMARFVPGVDDQFVMLYDADAYPTFKVQNIAANGEVWTGKGTETTCAFPPQETFVGGGKSKDHSPSENAVSSVIKVSYGKFDYYGGGDVTHNGQKYYDWKDVERPVADAVGRVEVMKADHHGSSDSNNPYIVNTLSPQAVIINVWRNVQPRGGIAKYNDADIFMSNLHPSMEEKLGDAMERVLMTAGHIVIRVNPDGRSYYIYALKDTDESMVITSRFGPYICK